MAFSREAAWFWTLLAGAAALLWLVKALLHRMEQPARRPVTPEEQEALRASRLLSADERAPYQKVPRKERKAIPKKDIGKPTTPLELFCQALAYVLKRRVRLTLVAKGGMSCKAGSQTSPILCLGLTLPLSDNVDFSGTKNRQKQYDTLGTVLSAILEKTCLLDHGDFRSAFLCYQRAQEVAVQGFKFVANPTDVGFAPLEACMDAIRDLIVRSVWAWLQPELLAKIARQQEAEQDNGDVTYDLFDEDYNPGQNSEWFDIMATRTNKRESKVSLLDQALALFEEPVPIVSPRLLQNLLRYHATVLGSPKDELGTVLFRRLIDRTADALVDNQQFCSTVLTNRVCAVSQLLTVYQDANTSMLRLIRDELQQMDHCKDGRALQQVVLVAPLWEAVAYMVPAAGAELDPTTSGRWTRQLLELPDYPVCLFRKAKKDDDVQKAIRATRHALKTSRNAAILVLRSALTNSSQQDAVFQWLGHMGRKNACLTGLLKDDLLKADGGAAMSSSRGFLLGAASSLLFYSIESLKSDLKEHGPGVFDTSYFSSVFFQLDPVEAYQRLFQGTSSQQLSSTVAPTQRYTSATHLFFLSSLLVRVAILPCLRMQNELIQDRKFRRVIDMVESAGKSGAKLSPQIQPLATSAISAWFGWKLFFEDKEFMETMTEFALLQLEWVATIAENIAEESSAAHIPDWICRDPCFWITHLARSVPSLIPSKQADKIVDVVTKLLDSGGSTLIDDGVNNFSFSPLVLSALVDILSVFVQAGIHKARKKVQIRKRGGRANGTSSMEETVNDRNLQVYMSLSRDDLGVAVYTNKRVCKTLCPVLFRVFRAVDDAEGAEADRDNAFSKLSTKAQIAELILRLWDHPNGACRRSILKMPVGNLSSFIAALASVVAVNFDFGFGAVEKVLKSADDTDGILSAYIDQATSQAVGSLQGARRFLSVLFTLSKDNQLARQIGRQSASNTDMVKKVCNLVVQLLIKLTGADGGTHCSLDEVDAVPTSEMYKNFPKMSTSERSQAAAGLAKKRTLAKETYGLDIASLCHLLLALCTKWHVASGKRDSSIVVHMSENEDCDIDHLENIYERLINFPEMLEGSAAGNALALFKHDGYIKLKDWKYKEIHSSLSGDKMHLRYLAQQDQLAPEEIQQLADVYEISIFLTDLRAAIAFKRVNLSRRSVTVKNIPFHERVLMAGSESTEEKYGEILSEWRVSSSPFAKDGENDAFKHKYDSAARKSALSRSGKVLVREARKCYKNLPTPSANASIFICFAEERMDLARAVVTGPVGSPYAHGLFVFDIFFPPSFPQVAPLVTFMTTGGGQVRMNPNLYTDGKVCISLLGSTNAADETQKWNPQQSSLAQLMISVQSQILGASDPYFNEGNGVPEMMRGTKAGKEGSFEYNNRVRLATLRYAMLEPLRSPPIGFAEVVLRHFSLCRKRILPQARRWVLEAHGSPLESRFERSYAELLFLLGEERLQLSDSLPPLKDDVDALEETGAGFAGIVEGEEKSERDDTSATDVVSDSGQPESS